MVLASAEGLVPGQPGLELGKELHRSRGVVSFILEQLVVAQEAINPGAVLFGEHGPVIQKPDRVQVIGVLVLLPVLPWWFSVSVRAQSDQPRDP